MCVHAVLDLVPPIDHAHGERVGTHLKAVLVLARLVQEVAYEVGQAPGRMIVVSRPVIDIVLQTHLLANSPVEAAGLVLSEGNVALEPSIGDTLRVVGIGAPAL